MASFSSPGSRILPDQAAFAEKPMSTKKQKIARDGFSTPLKCPSTPLRSPYPEKNLVQRMTDVKRSRCSSKNFEIQCSLGEGSFGNVYKALSLKDNQLYAIKRSKSPIWNTYDRIRQMDEITNSRVLSQHPNILHFIDAWEEGGHIYLQMELCELGSLKDLLSEGNPVSEPLIWKYLADIMQGLNHIHSNGLMHLDLKPENLLLSSSGSIKIGDFGCSATVNSTNMSEGDKLYMAPELLDDVFTPQADIFSVGLCIYEMATGFEMPSDGLSWRKLREGEVEFNEESSSLSNELKGLIVQMLHPASSLRPTSSTVLSHPNISSFLQSTASVCHGSGSKLRCKRTLDFPCS